MGCSAYISIIDNNPFSCQVFSPSFPPQSFQTVDCTSLQDRNRLIPEKILRNREKESEIGRKSAILRDCETCEIDNNFKKRKLLITLGKRNRKKEKYLQSYQNCLNGVLFF
jgi:hypothetical protein